MNLLQKTTRCLVWVLVFSCFCLVPFEPLFSEGFDNTNILIQEAVNHIYQKRYQKAHQALKQAYDQSPRNPSVHFNLGRLFEITKNPQEALREYRLASALDRSMVASERGIARCLVEIKRLRSIEQGQVMKQISEVRKRNSNQYSIAIKESQTVPAPVITQYSAPVSTPAPMVVAKAAPPSTNVSVSGKPPQAKALPAPQAEDLQNSLISRPPTPIPSEISAPVIELSPSAPSSTEVSAPIIELSPTSPTEFAQPEPAIQLSTISIPESPKPAQGSIPQRDSSSILNTHEPVMTPLYTDPSPPSISDDTPKQKTNREIQAENLIDRGSSEKAIALLEAASDDEFNHPHFLVLLGKAYTLKGNIFEAIKHLEEAIRIDKNYYIAYYLLGQNYEKVNLLDDAIKNYLIYFGVKPQARVAVEIARLYERTGNLQQAQIFYSKANAMNPGNPNLQGRINQTEGRLANDLYLRANHAFTMGDFKGALSLYRQARSMEGLDPTYQQDIERKIAISELRANQISQQELPAEEGFKETRKIYGTVNLRYSQLADVKFHTKFTDPVTVEWRGYIARSFKRYGQDFFLMIKELSNDELDELRFEQNDYSLNPNYTNQPIFLLTTPQGKAPQFLKVGALVTFTGRTDWRTYDVINDLGQTMKIRAFEYVSAHP